MSEPSFFILVGAPKSGTTSVAYWLGQHPAVRVPLRKEPRFFTNFSRIAWAGPKTERFAEGIVADEAAYLSSYGGETPGQWAIDASTDYLWCEDSPHLIKQWSRRFRVRLACILRNPIDRIVSEYQATIRDGMQSETLGASLALEHERFASHWHPLFYHVRRSSYARQVQRYQQAFGDDFLVLDFKELSQPDRLIDKLLGFLELPSAPIDTSVASNASYVYRFEAASQLINKRTVLGNIVRRVVPKPLRDRLRRGLQPLVVRRYRPTDTELSVLKASLADEIVRCREMSLPGASTWG